MRRQFVECVHEAFADVRGRHYTLSVFLLGDVARHSGDVNSRDDRLKNADPHRRRLGNKSCQNACQRVAVARLFQDPSFLSG